MGNSLPLFFSASDIDLIGEDDDECLEFAVPENHQREGQADVPPRIRAPQRLGLPPAYTGPPPPTFASSPFGTSTPTTMFASPSSGVFGAPQASSPFSSSTTFGASSPGFGSSNPAFGASSSPVFGSSASPFRGTSAFGSSTPFGATSTPAFGASSIPSFSFGSSRTFGQSTSSFGSGSTPSLFGPTLSLIGTPTQGAQASTPTFGGQQRGSRVMSLAPTTETEVNGTTQPAEKLESIAAMPLNKDKTHEELRWEDYQRGDKGSSPFAATTSSNLFGSTTSFFGSSPSLGATTSSLLFSSSSTPAFCSCPSLFGSSSIQGSTPSFGSGQGFGLNSFGATTSSLLFSSSSTPAFDSFTSLFGSSPTQGSTPSFGSGQAFGSRSFSTTTSSLLFSSSSTPTFGSRVMSFAPTTEREANGTTQPTEKLESIAAMPVYKGKTHEELRWEDYQRQPTWKLESIAAMPVYKDKAHEELRWEDYQRGDKGGQLPGRQSPGGVGFGLAISQSNAFAPVPAFGHTSAKPTNAFSSLLAANLFCSTYRSSPSIFGSPPSLFGSSPTQWSTPSILGSGQGFGFKSFGPT